MEGFFGKKDKKSGQTTRTMDDVDRVFTDVHRGVPFKGLGEQLLPSTMWRDPEDILADERYHHDGSKLIIGKLGDQIIGVSDPRHQILCAGSRSGKGRSVILPSLITYEGSVICIDLKAELANITARRRGAGLKGEGGYAGLGTKVCILDPFSITEVWVAQYKKSYNPLAILKPGSITIIEDAGLIADALVISSGAGADIHWDDSARNWLETLILHVATYGKLEGRRDLVTVRDRLTRGVEVIIDYMNGETEDLSGEEGLKAEIEQNAIEQGTLGNELIQGVLEGGISDYFDKADRERSGVSSVARRHTKFLDFPALQSVLRETGPEDTFDLTELKTAPNGMSIYLCLPAGRMSTCSRWFRLFINLALEAMERESSKPKVPVLFCLDEFPVLGFMSQIQSAIGQIASFHVKILAVLQDLSQLKAHYKDSWETFLGNAGIWQFFGNLDLTTLEFIQKRLGETSLIVSSESEVAHSQAMEGGTGASWSVKVRDLISPEEASRLFGVGDPLQRQLVIHGGETEPMILERVNYDQDRYFKHKTKDGWVNNFDDWF